MLKQKNATPAQATPETGLVLEGINLQLFAEVEPPAGDPPLGEPPATDPPASDPPLSGEPPAGDPPADDNPTGAPESYTDFAMPEGFTFDKETAGDFLTTAKEMNLTQDQAQKLVDLYGTRVATQQETHKQQVEAWGVESKKQFKQSEIDLANKTLGQFADKEMIELLASTGLGNHPKMVGLFKTIGSKFSEGTFVDTTSPTTAGKPRYANSPGLYK